ncbi:hypothetical protein ZOSMA_324G00090 [Zostera marina]|uniref:Kinesin motor domain-containing protein n=1 Tax=Zostera marina TaxID=29655 RepID=A0A0K9PAY7_ZOSMR|nr:hypothetical protein ZOSMA_324G00090 [Zostera marina]
MEKQMEKEKIYVLVRARPLSPEDAKASPWRISENSIALTNLASTKFDFDRIYGEECKTVEVYKARTRGIVESAVQGFNGTVFAYGQTSSGKTHTMRGSSDEPGVIPLAVHDLFRLIQENVNREFLVRISYMEIYNEDINDLLVPDHRKLQIKESIERGHFVAGLSEEIVTTRQQVLDLMEFGESHRRFGETSMNLYSSRSHTIFRMIIESREKTEGGDDSCDAVRESVLNLVDLAGSERAAKTGAEGVRLKEGCHINKSLMTLGTVIKKLSEGAESQGGHVPYRDSKLTRILQSALGGNANTAIICNITLAQVHIDETKTSLQFASRALRITNCASVNEILTDAALLNRQKKKIEELQKKLQGSNSEQWEMEILNLRNTLLQSELEKERIALELEEEKKEKALREKRLQQQEQKIANLSSMVLYSSREEDTTINQKKRRQTWCPIPSAAKHCYINNESTEDEHDENLPTKFQLQEIKCDQYDLYNERQLISVNIENNDLLGDVFVPDAHAFKNVTDRRKRRSKHVSNLMIIEGNNILKATDDNEEIANSFVNDLNQSTSCSNFTAKESENINVIKLLENQGKLLETEKASFQWNSDSVIELAADQKLSSKIQLSNTHEDTRLVKKECAPPKNQEIPKGTKDIPSTELLSEIRGIELEIYHSRDIVNNLTPVVDDVFHSFSVFSKLFMELKEFATKDNQQFLSVIHASDKVQGYMKMKVEKLETEKILLQNQAINLNKTIEEHNFELQCLKDDMSKQSYENNLEKENLYQQIVELQKELSCLSTSSLMKEKEFFRTKLKDTESKLKNSLQDKIKLQSEKAQIGRELKQLNCQTAHLERDIHKRHGKTKAYAGIDEQMQQMEDDKDLQFHASEMSVDIEFLKNDFLIATEEKQEALSTCEALRLELEDMSKQLNTAHSELELVNKEMDTMTFRLEESNSSSQKMQHCLDLISREKEELAVQLTNSLLELENTSLEAKEKLKISAERITILSNQLTDSLLELELKKKSCSDLDKALLQAKETIAVSEKNTLLEIRDRLKISEDEIAMLSNQLTNSLLELEIEKKKCSDLEKALLEAKEVMAMSEKNTLLETRDRVKISDDKIAMLSNQFINSQCELKMEKAKCSDIEKDLVQTKESMVILEKKMHTMSTDLLLLTKAKTDSEELVRRVAAMETTMQNDALKQNKEKTKLRMRLIGEHKRCETFRDSYKDLAYEMKLMEEKFEAVIAEQKKHLGKYAGEILKLKELSRNAAGQQE